MYSPSPDKLIMNDHGFSIYYVLLILLVISISLGVGFLAIGGGRELTSNMEKSEQAHLLALSGFERAKYFFGGGDNHGLDWEVDSLVETVNSDKGSYGTINLCCRKWGLFRLLSSTGNRLNATKTVTGIAVRSLPTELSAVLTLTGTSGGLVVAVGSEITDTVVLHHGQIKQGTNSGSQYIKAPLVCKVEPRLPFDRSELDTVYAAFKDAESGKGSLASQIFDTVVKVTSYTFPSGISKNRLVIAQTVMIPTDAVLNECAIVSKTVSISGNTNRCLVYADSVIQLSGGKHSSQFYSNDSLNVSRPCHIDQFNALVVHRQLVRDTLKGGITVDEGTIIKGSLICFSDTSCKPVKLDRPSVVIGKSSEIDGIVVTDEDIVTRDITFNGHVWARGIATSDKGIAYTNWLFGINFKKPPRPEPTIPFPIVGKIPIKIDILQDNLIGAIK